MKNNWFVANDNGEIIAHDCDKAKALIIASEMAEKEPNAGWEALCGDED